MVKSAALETLAVHGGRQRDAAHGALITPIVTATSFQQANIDEYGEYCYSRVKNPTRLAYETALADLEAGVFATATASGMAAASLALDLLDHGAHVISMEGIYGGTHRLFEQRRRSSGLIFTYLDLNDTEAFETAMRKCCEDTAAATAAKEKLGTMMVWLETPTNPLLNLVDIESVVGKIRRLEKLHGVRALVVVDNTFATAYNQQPLKLGADVVMLSTSKFIGGHSDMIGGALVVGDAVLAERLAFLAKVVGAIASPHDAYLALRGMKTLAVRLQRQSENAMRLAAHLEHHPKIHSVCFPGLPSHPQYELCKRQMRTPGAVVTLRLASGAFGARGAEDGEDKGSTLKRKRDEESTADARCAKAALKRFFGALELFVLAESLGGVESMINHSATMSHGGMTKEQRAAVGIYDDTLRVSCGIEAVEDLIADFEKGLAAV